MLFWYLPLYFPTTKNIFRTFNRNKIQEISDCFANESTTFFANNLGASFLVHARFEADILLLVYVMARNRRIFTAKFSFF